MKVMAMDFSHGSDNMQLNTGECKEHEYSAEF